MGRKKKTVEGTEQPARGVGDNSGALTDDERRALTLHHKKLYEAADALVEKAKADRTAISDLAKSELGKGAIAEIKDMIAYSDEKKLKGSLERTLRLARWLGMAVGTQAQMFEIPVNHHEEGKTAGMEGQNCQAPAHLAQVEQQDWIQGWHEGQSVLMSAFKKKRPADQASEEAEAA